MTPEQIAEVCHEVNRAYCNSIGDDSQQAWANASDAQRSSAVAGVLFNLANPEAPPSASHESWLKDKLLDDWVYGTKKDEKLKTHPCILPYEKLPKDQQTKDYLFKAVVNTLSRMKP